MKYSNLFVDQNLTWQQQNTEDPETHSRQIAFKSKADHPRMCVFS